MKFRTDRILGAQLDWAVAKCEDRLPASYGDWKQTWPRYSTDWSHGGLILEREFILLDSPEPNVWTSSVWANNTWVYGDGPTALIAAMRAYVASKLGDEIEIPEELC